MAQQDGLGTRKMVCLGNLARLGNLLLSIRWSRHRKDGVPKKLVAQ